MAFIVADSGGTGTSIAFYQSEDHIRYIETAALHPKFLLSWGDAEYEHMRSQLPEDLSAPLFFYGAGCASEEVAAQVKECLHRLGFTDVTVFPDILGACRACCENDPGTVAILGTGSVVLKYDGNNITERIGGFGSYIGDEGSGFHFGRIVLKAFLSDTLPLVSVPGFENAIGTESGIRAKLATPDAQAFIAAIAGNISDEGLEKYHVQNLREFIAAHFASPEGMVLHVVGTYGWKNRDILEKLLREKGAKTGIMLRNPIAQLVRFHAAN